MSIANKILFFYCLVFALFLTISGILTSSSIQQLALQLIFIPVTGYFIFTLITQLLRKNQDQDTSKAIFRSKTTFFILFIFLGLLLISSSNAITKKSLENRKIISPLPITTQIPPSPTPKKTEKMYVVVKTDEENTKVNIRESASASATVLEKTTTNQKYEYITQEKDWYKITLKDGSFGYIHKDFASIVADL